MSASPTKPRTTQRFTLERLEDRCNPVSVNFSGSTVSIIGDSWNNSARVFYESGKLQVHVESTPTNGFILTPSVVDRSYASGPVKQIYFEGQEGNDSFVSDVSDIPSLALGGSGDDYLEGSAADDELRGGADNDTLRGFGGDDRLYGDSGNDLLKGGSGNDDLFGGFGTDTLYGNAGHNLFLQFSGEKEQQDYASDDAIIYFKNGNASWSQQEIRFVDAGLFLLHKRTGNDRLLETYKGKSITIRRDHKDSSGKASILADNNSVGLIHMYDSSFKSQTLATATIIHEMGHNFDDEQPDYSGWKSLSGWRTSKPSNLSDYGKSGDGKWYYLKSAPFALNYGHTNPREDWATSWERYFTKYYGLQDTQKLQPIGNKYTYLGKFFDSLK